jgi:hypothetical protein
LSGEAGEIGTAIDAYQSHAYIRACASLDEVRRAIIGDWAGNYTDGESRLILLTETGTRGR